MTDTAGYPPALKPKESAMSAPSFFAPTGDHLSDFDQSLHFDHVISCSASDPDDHDDDADSDVDYGHGQDMSHDDWSDQLGHGDD